MTTLLRIFALALATALPAAATAADTAREAEVARRGPDVMPFDLKATQHIFTKKADGGIQKVVVRRKGDSQQIKLVREHLREIETQFRKGDFSGPAHIHGEDMPGLAQLRAASPGDIRIAYRDIAGGAELSYRTRKPELVNALHAWFDAQVSDHGPDAMAGHEHMHHGRSHKP